MLKLWTTYYLTRFVVLADVLVEIATLGFLDLGRSVERTADLLERLADEADRHQASRY